MTTHPSCDIDTLLKLVNRKRAESSHRVIFTVSVTFNEYFPLGHSILSVFPVILEEISINPFISDYYNRFVELIDPD